MTTIALTQFGTFDRRVKSARHALKTWGYRLAKARGIDKPDTAGFAVIDLKSGTAVVGESAQAPSATLADVERWFNMQGFAGKVAADGGRLRDFCKESMNAAQRDILERMWALPRDERTAMLRYLSAWLLRERYDLEP
jgi:hypothetical protein